VLTRYTRRVLDDGGVILVRSNADILTLPPGRRLDKHGTATLEASQDATNDALTRTAHALALEAAPHPW
jgi:hypothetical protein